MNQNTPAITSGSPLYACDVRPEPSFNAWLAPQAPINVAADLAQQLTQQVGATVLMSTPRPQRPILGLLPKNPSLQREKLGPAIQTLAKADQIVSLPQNQRTDRANELYDSALETLPLLKNNDSPEIILHRAGWLLSRCAALGHALALKTLVDVLEQYPQQHATLNKQLQFALQALLLGSSEWTGDCLAQSLLMYPDAASRQATPAQQQMLQTLQAKADSGHNAAVRGLHALTSPENLNILASVQPASSPSISDSGTNHVAETLFHPHKRFRSNADSHRPNQVN